MLKIYHNNRCSKSRCALQVVEALEQPFELVEYLKTPPSEAEIRELLVLLGKKPLELIRQKETLFQEKFKGQTLSDEAWIKVMAENPVLIERPIVVANGRAWIARDEESLEEMRFIAGHSK
ncbi:MAG: arsenate reductase family protein [Saprospiraceae bacterium]|nr:arsenate reductase family protein [Saprospiraceae bacterium]